MEFFNDFDQNTHGKFYIWKCSCLFFDQNSSQKQICNFNVSWFYVFLIEFENDRIWGQKINLGAKKFYLRADKCGYRSPSAGTSGLKSPTSFMDGPIPWLLMQLVAVWSRSSADVKKFTCIWPLIASSEFRKACIQIPC